MRRSPIVFSALAALMAAVGELGIVPPLKYLGGDLGYIYAELIAGLLFGLATFLNRSGRLEQVYSPAVLALIFAVVNLGSVGGWLFLFEAKTGGSKIWLVLLVTSLIFAATSAYFYVKALK